MFRKILSVGMVCLGFVGCSVSPLSPAGVSKQDEVLTVTAICTKENSRIRVYKADSSAFGGVKLFEIVGIGQDKAEVFEGDKIIITVGNKTNEPTYMQVKQEVYEISKEKGDIDFKY